MCSCRSTFDGTAGEGKAACVLVFVAGEPCSAVESSRPFSTHYLMNCYPVHYWNSSIMWVQGRHCRQKNLRGDTGKDICVVF